MSIFTQWGSTEADRKLSFSCDEKVKNINGVYYRAVSVAAPPSVVYRWLCQMKVAPYSYDKLDNGGKQSPQHLMSKCETIKKGEKMMSIFSIDGFVPNQEITLTMDVPPGKFAVWYVPTAITYRVLDLGNSQSRVVVKYVASWLSTPIGIFEHYFVVFADFIMMRRQLLNFKYLAEKDYRTSVSRE